VDCDGLTLSFGLVGGVGRAEEEAEDEGEEDGLLEGELEGVEPEALEELEF